MSEEYKINAKAITAIEKHKGTLNNQQKEHLEMALMHTKTTPSYLSDFCKNHPQLNADEVIYITEMIGSLGTNFRTVNKWLNKGYTVKDTERAIILNKNKRREYTRIVETESGNKSFSEESLTHNNMQAIGEILNTKDVNTIEQYVGMIEDKLDELGSQIGISTAISYIEDEYRRNGNSLTLDCLIMRAANIIPSDFYNED